MFDRFAPESVASPYALYERVRERGPFHDPALDLWIVGRYGDVRTVLADAGRFSSAFRLRSPADPPAEVAAVLATGYPEVHVLANQDPPDHAAVRAVVAAAFTPRRVRELTPLVQRRADELVDRFAGAGQADLVGELAWPLPLDVICTLLGLPVADAPRIRGWVDALTELTSYGTPLDRQVAAAHGSVAFERYLAAFVRDRRAAPADDLTSDVLPAGLTDTEMVSLLVTLVFAGHETTANLIGNTLLAVLGAPAVDVDAAVEETLRQDPPVQGMFRRARVDADLGGVTSPAGAMVFAVIGAANRDPAAFAGPAEFRPGRTGRPHLAFGRGPHFCLGAQIARLEAGIAVRTLLHRLPGLEAAPGFVPPYVPHLMHRGPRRLDARWSVDRPAAGQASAG